MGQQTEQIVRRKLSDEVFARLKTMITSGELQPGDEMPSERELMERFGVGRPAIREAMQALAGMGLVAISHGERAKVLELTAQSIFRQMDMTAKMMLAKSSDTLEHLKSARIFFERRHGARGGDQRRFQRYCRSQRHSRQAAGIAWRRRSLHCRRYGISHTHCPHFAQPDLCRRQRRDAGLAEGIPHGNADLGPARKSSPWPSTRKSSSV